MMEAWNKHKQVNIYFVIPLTKKIVSYYFFTHERTKISVKAFMNMCNSKTPDHPIKSFKFTDHLNHQTVYSTESDDRVDVMKLSLGFDIIFEVVEYQDTKKFEKVCFICFLRQKYKILTQAWEYRSEMDSGLVQFVMQAKPLKFGGRRINTADKFQFMSLRQALYGFIEVTGEKWKPRFAVHGEVFEVGNVEDSPQTRKDIYSHIKNLPDMTVDVIHYLGPIGLRCNMVCTIGVFLHDGFCFS